MNREIAELHYIVEAMQLDGYGMEFYAVKDEVGLALVYLLGYFFDFVCLIVCLFVCFLFCSFLLFFLNNSLVDWVVFRLLLLFLWFSVSFYENLFVCLFP